MSGPRPPRLPDPASSPRVTANGRQDRDRPIFHRSGGSREDFSQWEVEVTPLVATSTSGRDVNPAHPDAPGPRGRRVVFEVRAAYYGQGLPVFGRKPNTRLIPTTHSEDEQLAMAIARALVEILSHGGREIEIVALAKDVEERRG